MLTSFYFYEREVKVQLLDKDLWNPVHALLPAFVMVPHQQEGGGDEGMRQMSMRGERPPQIGGPSRDRGMRPPPRHSEGRGDFGWRPGRLESEPRRGSREGEGVQRATGSEPRVQRVRHERPIAVVENQGYYVLAWESEDELYRSENAPEGLEIPTILNKNETLEIGVQARWNGANREVIQPTPRGGVLVGVSGDRIAADLSSFRAKLIGIGSAIIFVGFAGGWWIARRAMLPLRSMAQTAVQISEGDLSRRIDLDRVENELGDLGKVLNDSFEKIEASVLQQIRFTGDASHEMRTPLAVILAKTELALMRERSPEKYRETIQVCHESAEHMQSLIESLLELAKVDSGEFSVEPSSGSLAILVEDVVTLLEPLAQKRDIRMSAKLEPVDIMIDVQRMKQVLINLLSNAIKYNRNGGKIDVSMKQGIDWIELVVKDTGPGISEEALPHIFDRFYKVDDVRASEGGSTGLGLSISKAIVEAHGGVISVESELNVGTAFTIRLLKNIA
ncbi:sensor histidine kinase [Rubritalea spongiae]|uniref:histidine kinase n=1 Tax=Rubritalea spongiae TaxID=430797 RepID=A0ABW5DYC7_9BACT